MIEIYDEKDNVYRIDGSADIYIDGKVNIRIFEKEIEVNIKNENNWKTIKIKEVIG